MGQSFLIDDMTLKTIINTAQLTQKDIILEIGPGIGTLTRELAKKAKRVIAIEKDGKMVEILKEILRDYDNIEIIKGNALKITNLPTTHYKLVSNIPYYLTSPIIRKFLEEKNKPGTIVLMVQKEVAQRICSKPPRMSLLAVATQFYAKPEIVSCVSKKCFWPIPKVDSAIIRISNIKNQKSKIFIERFFKIVRAGFLQPRKQLANNLSKALKKDKNKINLWLLKNNIDPKQRAETLSIENWINLTKN